MYGGSHDTNLWLTYPILSRVCGVIYLFLPCVKADAASFGRGMLSVSWGAQFSTLFLPANCFFLSSLFKRSAIEFKCEKINLDLYTDLSSSMGLKSSEKTFGLYCTAQVVFSKDQARR